MFLRRFIAPKTKKKPPLNLHSGMTTLPEYMWTTLFACTLVITVRFSKSFAKLMRQVKDLSPDQRI